jgi:uncharacterized protein (DUF1330 family)
MGDTKPRRLLTSGSKVRVLDGPPTLNRLASASNEALAVTFEAIRDFSGRRPLIMHQRVIGHRWAIARHRTTARARDNIMRRRRMPAYFIVDNEVTDPAGFEEYRKQVPGTVEKYGGKFLVRGGQMQALEGDWKPKRIVVTEFPSIEQARRWYDSEEYRALKALRLRTARGSVVLVEGV